MTTKKPNFLPGHFATAPHAQLDAKQVRQLVAGMSGRKSDAGKDPWHLLPLGAVAEIVKVLGFGAKKYGEHNWQGLDKADDRYLAACLRHLSAWQQGEDLDPESGLMHLAHAACCLIFLIFLGKGKVRRKP